MFSSLLDIVRLVCATTCIGESLVARRVALNYCHNGALGNKKHPYVLLISLISDRFLVRLVAYRAMSFPRCVDATVQLSADLWFRYIRLPLAASASLLVRLPLKPIRLSTTQLSVSSIFVR
jgi:hypothetical protein